MGEPKALPPRRMRGDQVWKAPGRRHGPKEAVSQHRLGGALVPQTGRIPERRALSTGGAPTGSETQVQEWAESG